MQFAHMTMILGSNLSNRLYLAADSRITVQHPDRHVRYHDNILKIVPLYGKNILNSACKDDCYISFAVAGDVTFASFCSQALKTGISSGKLSGQIRQLKDQILPYLTEAIKNWMNDGLPYRSCCFIFAGVDPSRPRRINKEKLEKLTADYSKLDPVPAKQDEQFKRLVATDPTMRLINEKLKEQANKTILDLIAESRIPKIPQYLEEMLMQDGVSSKIPDLFIFSVLIDLPRPLVIESAEWGESLAYGCGKITKEDISIDMLPKMEFSPGLERNQPHLTEYTFHRLTIEKLAQERGLKEIGGCIWMNNLALGTSQISGDSKKSTLINGQYYYVDENGRPELVITFEKFNAKNKSSSLQASM